MSNLKWELMKLPLQFSKKTPFWCFFSIFTAVDDDSFAELFVRVIKMLQKGE